MVVLRLTNECFRCKEEVDTLKARSFIAANGEQRYECFECFRKYKRDPLLAQTQEKIDKKQHFCEKCKYSFIARSASCPYCNSTNYVVTGLIKVGDLL